MQWRRQLGLSPKIRFGEEQSARSAYCAYPEYGRRCIRIIEDEYYAKTTERRTKQVDPVHSANRKRTAR